MEEKDLLNKENEENEGIIILTDEDGVESSFEVIGSIKIEDTEYFAMIPQSDKKKNNEQEEYVILKLIKDENGEEVLSTIDDDDEFDNVADAFDDQFFSEVDYDA